MQRVTNIELFFDLVYVFAVTQLSHYLIGHSTVACRGYPARRSQRPGPRPENMPGPGRGVRPGRSRPAWACRTRPQAIRWMCWRATWPTRILLILDTCEHFATRVQASRDIHQAHCYLFRLKQSD